MSASAPQPRYKCEHVSFPVPALPNPAASNTVLIEALRELAAREVECEKLSDALLRARAALQELGDSRNMLFTEFHKARKEFASERLALGEKAKQAEAEAAELRKQLDAASDLVERLKVAPPEQLRNDLTTATRKLAMLQVRELRLQRALEAATAGEQAARADREEATRDLEEVSEVARARISALERERGAAKARTDRLESQLKQSVPRREVEAAREELRSLQAAHRVQLEESTTRVLQEGEYKRAVDEASMARSRAAAAEAEAAALRGKLRIVEEELRKPPAGGDAVLASLRSEAVTLRVELESRALDAAHHKAERDRAEEGKAELAARVQQLESRLAKLADAAHASHEGERKAREQLATCVPLAEHQERVRAGDAAVKEAEALREQVGVMRDRLRAAEAAAMRKAALTDLRDAELKALRTALRDHARESDLKLALARVSEENVRLRSRDVELKHRVHLAVRHPTCPLSNPTLPSLLPDPPHQSRSALSLRGPTASSSSQNAPLSAPSPYPSLPPDDGQRRAGGGGETCPQRVGVRGQPRGHTQSGPALRDAGPGGAGSAARSDAGGPREQQQGGGVGAGAAAAHGCPLGGAARRHRGDRARRGAHGPGERPRGPSGSPLADTAAGRAAGRGGGNCGPRSAGARSLRLSIAPLHGSMTRHFF